MQGFTTSQINIKETLKTVPIKPLKDIIKPCSGGKEVKAWIDLEVFAPTWKDMKTCVVIQDIDICLAFIIRIVVSFAENGMIKDFKFHSQEEN